jgi:hypothetical protein
MAKPRFNFLLAQARLISGHPNQEDNEKLDVGVQRLLNNFSSFPPPNLFAGMLIEMAVYAARNPARIEQIVNEITQRRRAAETEDARPAEP